MRNLKYLILSGLVIGAFLIVVSSAYGATSPTQDFFNLAGRILLCISLPLITAVVLGADTIKNRLTGSPQGTFLVSLGINLFITITTIIVLLFWPGLLNYLGSWASVVYSIFIFWIISALAEALILYFCYPQGNRLKKATITGFLMSSEYTLCFLVFGLAMFLVFINELGIICYLILVVVMGRKIATTLVGFFLAERKISAGGKRGFEIIILIVYFLLAIIGPVAIIVSSGIYRPHPARDARIVSDIVQIRAIAETYRTNKPSENYIGFCENHDLIILQDDIIEQKGTNFLCNVKEDGAEYCAEVQLRSGKWWCVDSTLRSKQYPTNPICGQESVYSCE